MDNGSGMIIPSSREVCFNASIHTNDGLIAHSIARRDNITFEEASIRLDEATATLLSCLEEEHEVAVGNIGTLHRDCEGRLSFTQRYSATAFANLLGYYPIEPVKVDTSEASEDCDLPTTSTPFPNYRPDKYYYLAINKTFVKTAAIILCILTLGLGILIPFRYDSQQRELASVVPIEKVSEVLKEQKPSTAKETARDNAPRFINESECNGKYYLIIGTFRTEDEARSYLNDKDSWDNSIEIIKSPNMYKISATSSTNRDEVLEALRSDDIRTRYGESWIWTAPSL